MEVMTTWTPHILLKHHNHKLIPYHWWWKLEKPPWISLLNENNNNEIWKKEQRQRKASNCWRHQAEKLVSIRICVTDKYFMRNLSLIVMYKGTLRWFLSIAYAFCTAHKNNVIRLISAHIPRTLCCFLTNGPDKKVRWSLALERARWPIFFVA